MRDKAPPALTVLMPAYNEEQILVASSRLLQGKLAELGVRYELLIVDDGSSDGTPRLADALAAADGRVRVLHHAENLGVGQALCTGFQAARGEFTIFIPADLAMDLDELYKYLDAAGGADVVVGLRTRRGDISAMRRLISWININAVRLLFWMPIHQFQYICMYRTRFLQSVQLDYAHSPFVQTEVLIKARDMGYVLTEVKINYYPRMAGVARGARLDFLFKSSYDMLHFWLHWLFRARSEDGRRDWRARTHDLHVPDETAAS